jgi:predicted Fe-Mo cluster-binding NifX family protein
MIALDLDESIVNQEGNYNGYVAIPIKDPKENQPIMISPLFGKVKFFALYDKKLKKIEIAKNSLNRGGAITRFLNILGIKEIITLHMGEGAYKMAVSSGMKVYFAQEDKQTLEEVISKFESNQLPLITEENFELLNQFGCGNHHHHEHQHDHHHHHHHG